MMDQARQVLHSVIPATQWAMQYLNKSAQDFSTGFNGTPGEGVNSGNGMQSLGDSVANATPAGQVDHAGVSAMSHMLPLALGLSRGDAAAKFGNALRGANKMLDMPVHPDDIKEIAPALERILSTPESNANYFVNQLPQDHAQISQIAEAYMPGAVKQAGNDPVKVAQQLLQRIIEDRQVYGSGIPK
jgi:hypothetical protein